MKDFDYNLKTSVTVVQGCLIATLPNEINDDEIENGSSMIIIEASKSSIVGAILDLSMVSVLDSFTFTLLENTSKSISLMGVMVVWIGLKPGVISALMDLNVDVSSIKAALNLEEGLKLISKAKLNKSRNAN